MKKNKILGIVFTLALIVGCTKVIKVNSGEQYDQLNKHYQIVEGSGKLIIDQINSFGISGQSFIYAVQRQGAVEELVTSAAVSELIINDLTTAAGVTTGDLLFIDRIKYKDDGTTPVHSRAGYEFNAPGVSENIYFEQINIIPWTIWKEGQYLDISDLSIHDSAPLQWDLLLDSVNLNSSTMNIVANESSDCGLYALPSAYLPGHSVVEEDLAVTVNNVQYFNQKVVFKTQEGNYGYLRVPGQLTDGAQKGVQLFIYYYNDGRTYLN